MVAKQHERERETSPTNPDLHETIMSEQFHLFLFRVLAWSGGGRFSFRFYHASEEILVNSGSISLGIRE